jgi:hypothetical protein
MGKYHAGDDSHAIQVLRIGSGIYSAPAYWNKHVYIFAADDVLKDFAVQQGRLSPQPVAQGATKFIDPGATPTVSANGLRNGIVWVLRSKGWRSPDTKAVLYAYDAANVARELYTSEQNSPRDHAGLCLRFNIPTVANGKVYVPAKREINVYGLLSPRPVSNQPPATSHQPPATNHQPPATNHQPPTTNHQPVPNPQSPAPFFPLP